MKGQSVNIDWSIGLGLMIITLLSSIIFLAGYQTGENSSNLENLATQVGERLESQFTDSLGQKKLVTRSPFTISSVPVDRKHFFDKFYVNASLGNENVELYKNRTVTVIEKSNATRTLNLFPRNITGDVYQDIDTGTWMNNSDISVKPGGNGLQSLKINDKQLLSSSADLNTSTFNIEEYRLFAEMRPVDLNIYNGSTELILENASDISFQLKNLSTLYWEADNSTTELVGSGSFKQGTTKGFTVASNYGISFIGNMEADVSKPDSSTVLAEINASRVRIRLHDKDYKAGWKRIKSYSEGKTVFGPLNSFPAAPIARIEELNNKSDQELQNLLERSPDRFNISVSNQTKKITSIGSQIPLQQAVSREGFLTGFYRNGSLTELSTRVTVW